MSKLICPSVWYEFTYKKQGHKIHTSTVRVVEALIECQMEQAASQFLMYNHYMSQEVADKFVEKFSETML